MSIGGRLRSAVAPGPPPVLVGLFGLLGFLVVTAASSTTAIRRAEAPRRARLAEVISQRRSQVETLEDAVQELRTQVQDARRESARRTAGDVQLADALSILALQAGTAAVHGPGVEIRMTDSNRDVPDDDAGAYRIHDRDLQLVVNALLSVGAEAVSINDVRLVATSPIRSAGQTIVAGFRPLTPPYTVRAIGADPDRFDGTAVARLYARWRDTFGLGFRVRAVDDLTVPAHAGRVALTTAAPL